MYISGAAGLSSLPLGQGHWDDIIALSVSDASFSVFPRCICAQTNLTRLRLINSQLTDLPSWISSLKSLTELSLATNPQLTTREKDVNRLFSSLKALAWLKIVNVSECSLGQFPEVFLHLPKLEDVNVASNALQLLPSSLFSALPKLTILDVSDNLLTAIPDDGLEDCISLRELRCSNNRLSELPRACLISFISYTCSLSDCVHVRRV